MTFGLICPKLLGRHFFKMLITSGRPPTGKHRMLAKIVAGCAPSLKLANSK